MGDCERFPWWFRSEGFRLNGLGICRDSLSREDSYGEGGLCGDILLVTIVEMSNISLTPL